ncbi:phage major tail protein, TP901-1 family [Staphylococcus pseudoxylosus]|uniref:phage major tail protein, TP901-1 family n=1 Tax=Staphylococcus pseudoxylosus TaxID=2282419 RepID=UPI002DBEE1B4|nr:phage major tail protein, TP901-1 family [Staphylococcus pseudoxylosus]MEB7753286.1 phage major tail protein, TP901-1 family [Staphylococcus pseudoxylosus]
MAIKQGSDELALIRKLGDALEADKIMWVTEIERETERDSDSEATIDGSVNSGGSLESTVKLNSYMEVDDELSDEIEDATEDAEPYELWVINKKVKGTGENSDKYKAEYRQGHWNSITRTNEADSIAEFETEFGVYGKKQRGWASLPKVVEENKTAYGFHDTTADDPADDGLADAPDENIPQPDDSNDNTGEEETP